MLDYTLITENNFIIYKTFIQDCIENTLNHNFNNNIEIEIQTLKDLQIYTQSVELYIPTKNNKMIGLVGISKNDTYSLISTFVASPSRLCPLSSFSLSEFVSELIILEAKKNVYKNFTYITYSKLLLQHFIKRFKKYEIKELTLSFVIFNTSISIDNIYESYLSG